MPSFSRATAAMRCILAAWAISISDGIGRSLTWKPRFCVTPLQTGLDRNQQESVRPVSGSVRPVSGRVKASTESRRQPLASGTLAAFQRTQLNGEGENHEKPQ